MYTLTIGTEDIILQTIRISEQQAQELLESFKCGYVTKWLPNAEYTTGEEKHGCIKITRHIFTNKDGLQIAVTKHSREG